MTTDYENSHLCVEHWKTVSSKFVKPSITPEFLAKKKAEELNKQLSQKLVKFPLVFDFPDQFPKKRFAGEIVFVIGEDVCFLNAKNQERVPGYYWVIGKEATIFRVHEVSLKPI